MVDPDGLKSGPPAVEPNDCSCAPSLAHYPIHRALSGSCGGFGNFIGSANVKRDADSVAISFDSSATSFRRFSRSVSEHNFRTSIFPSSDARFRADKNIPLSLARAKTFVGCGAGGGMGTTSWGRNLSLIFSFGRGWATDKEWFTSSRDVNGGR